MAESVDALVSNTSGAIRAGSTPALGTKKGTHQLVCPFFVPYAILFLCVLGSFGGLRLVRSGVLLLGSRTRQCLCKLRKIR